MTNRLSLRPFPRLTLRTTPLALAVVLAVAPVWGLVLVSPAAARAQDEQSAAKPEAVKRADGDAAAQQTERAKEERPRGPLPVIQRLMPNIKVDVTITDQSGTGKPIVKTLSAIMADRQEASIRTVVQVLMPMVVNSPGDAKPATTWTRKELPLNVDLRSEVTDSPTFARVGLSLHYGTASKTNDGTAATQDLSAEITQKFNVFLESGKPMIISQSADAATDRKVTIELKATILK